MEMIMFILGAASVLVLQLLVKTRLPKNVMKAIYNPIVEAEYDFKTEIMKVKYHDGTTAKYHGSCTVWHSYPLMKRVGTLGEGTLSDVWHYIKTHGNPYPNAHKNK